MLAGALHRGIAGNRDWRQLCKILTGGMISPPPTTEAHDHVPLSTKNLGSLTSACAQIQCDDASCANPGRQMPALVVDLCGALHAAHCCLNAAAEGQGIPCTTHVISRGRCMVP